MPEKFEQQFGGKMAEQKPEVREKPIDRLRRFIREVSLGLRKEGVPLNEKGRINMDAFRGVHERKIIELDKEWVRDLKVRWERVRVAESKWAGLLSREQILRQKTMGEIWEMLATAILHKKLGEDFIVCRTSEYDDARNKIDGVIIDKRSGNIVCAFDDVGADQGQRFEEKKRKVLERNWEKGGADLKYGVSLEEKGGVMEVKRGPVYHIPLFYFALPADKVKKGLEIFSAQEVRPEEEEIFRGFINSFKEQTAAMKGEPLHPKVREKLELFEEYMVELK